MLFIQIAICVVCIYIVVKLFPKLFKFLQLGTSELVDNPFLKDCRLPIKAKILDQKLRDKVLKQNFKEEKIPTNLDAIVIGSGIGGLTASAILSKAGKRVLILEQHDQAGGSCHTFIDKGYEFDVGIHYVGEMNRQTENKTLLDQISEGQIEWADLAEDYDTVVYKKGKEYERFVLCADIHKQKEHLKSKFPEERKVIDRYYEIVEEINQCYKGSMAVKFIPLPIIKIVDYLGIINWFTNFFKWNSKSINDVVSDLTQNQTLKDIFSYCFGNFGTLPSESGFPMQALMISHFSGGPSFPVGGGSELPFNIIPVIEKAGGRVLVNAEVINIIINSKGKATGVIMKHGSKKYEIHAPVIISNAGVYNTLNKFLPREIAEKSRLYPFAQNVDHGMTPLSIFVGLDAPADDLDIDAKKNLWVFGSRNIDQICGDYLKHSKDDFENFDLPLQFISFPSTKDPLWESKYPGKTTMVIISLVNYKWFEEWEKKPALRRGDDYEALKNTAGHLSIDYACEMFPKIKDHIDYVNVGSPLSNNHYLGSPKGEVYGLDHIKDRFSLMNNALLRSMTDIEGLFLTGQDICTCGVTGAMWGGIFCAQQVLGRNVIGDLRKLHKQIITTKND